MPLDQKAPANDKNIILIGFMGVGKTTVGQIIAAKLNREFIDIDHEIERKYQMPITQIFKELGEKQFRETEKQMISDYCTSAHSKILSLGGGAFLQEEIRQICMSTGIVLFLDISWDVWKESRLQLILDSRPLLQNNPLEEIKELFDSRRQVYSQSHIQFNVDGLGFEEAARQIINKLMEI